MKTDLSRRLETRLVRGDIPRSFDVSDEELRDDAGKIRRSAARGKASGRMQNPRLRVSSRLPNREGDDGVIDVVHARLHPSHTFCEKHAWLHVKGEGEDYRRRCDRTRHRGMACNHRIGVVVRRIICGGWRQPGNFVLLRETPRGTLFYSGEQRMAGT
jgi:hypothetical protein